MTKTPHKHAEIIKAWADGAEIEYYEHGWHDCTSAPIWDTDVEYRIKPEPPAYPQTKMTDDELLFYVPPPMFDQIKYIRRIADVAIARAVQDGDVITLDEHNAAFAKVLYDKQHSTLSKVACAFAEAMALESAKSTPGPGGYPLSDGEIASFASAARMRIRKVLAGIIVSVLKDQNASSAVAHGANNENPVTLKGDDVTVKFDEVRYDDFKIGFYWQGKELYWHDTTAGAARVSGTLNMWLEQ